MITVREARPGDGVLLLQTTRLLAEMHGLLHGFTATAQQYEDALFAANPVIGGLIAEDGAAFAGSIIWHRSFSTNSGREIIYLEDLVVLPEHRRKGVARALMQALARLAKARGTPAVFWFMAQWNEEAEGFYRSIGAEIDKDFAICTWKDDALEGFAS